MQQSLYSYYIALNELEYSIGGVKWQVRRIFKWKKQLL
jgi:hypothetical protein